MTTSKTQKIFQTSKEEQDTYDQKSRAEKEKLSDRQIAAHWDARAKRQDLQTVMSARHTLEENIEATKKLQNDIFDFLGDLVTNKTIFELGVGVGRMTSELARRAKHVVGTDISPIMLKKAHANLKDFDNIELHQSKITDLALPPKSFDLVFDSIVLLHILNPTELESTAAAMKELSNNIFIVEHTYEGPDFPISKYTILRKPEEYEQLFKPFKLVKQKTHLCADDNFTMIIFQK